MHFWRDCKVVMCYLRSAFTLFFFVFVFLFHKLLDIESYVFGAFWNSSPVSAHLWSSSIYQMAILPGVVCTFFYNDCWGVAVSWFCSERVYVKEKSVFLLVCRGTTHQAHLFPSNFTLSGDRMTNGVGPVDGGQVWLVNCLNATLDANPQVRTAAEEALKQASVHPGLSLFLLNTKGPLLHLVTILV